MGDDVQTGVVLDKLLLSVVDPLRLKSFIL